MLPSLAKRWQLARKRTGEVFLTLDGEDVSIEVDLERSNVEELCATFRVSTLRRAGDGATCLLGRAVTLKSLVGNSNSVDNRLSLEADRAGPAQAGTVLPYRSLRRLDGNVQRVYVEGKPVGTCILLRSGQVVTAAHCVMDDDVPCDNVSGFGCELEHLFSSVDEDYAFLKPKEGVPKPDASCGFVLRGLSNYCGVLTLIAYPRATDRLSDDGTPLQEPVHTRGQVSSWSPDGKIVVADYSGGLPNASGGAVVGESGELLGLHAGLVWHDPADAAEHDDAEDSHKDPTDVAKPSDAMHSPTPSGSLDQDNITASLKCKLKACSLRLRCFEAHVPLEGSLPYLVPSEILVAAMIDAGIFRKTVGADGYRGRRKRSRASRHVGQWSEVS